MQIMQLYAKPSALSAPLRIILSILAFGWIGAPVLAQAPTFSLSASPTSVSVVQAGDGREYGQLD